MAILLTVLIGALAGASGITIEYITIEQQGRINEGRESADHHVGPAQPRRDGLLRPSDRADPASRPACGARYPLHVVLDALSGLHSGAGLVRYRQIHPPDRILGQRRPVRRLDPELASPAATGRPPGRLDRQAAFSVRRGGFRLL